MRADKKFKLRIMFLILPPILLALVLIFTDKIIALAESLPPCVFYEKLHIYCPACGNTRSVIALLHGDILGSLRYNVTVVFLCLLGLVFYIENIIALLTGGRKKIRLVPRGNIFVFAVIAGFALYFIGRNLFVI